MDDSINPRSGLVVDTVIGFVVGGVVGAVIAVNLVIFSGIGSGYESTLSEVFRENTLVGILTVAVLCAGPVVGIAVARRLRHRRTDDPGVPGSPSRGQV